MKVLPPSQVIAEYRAAYERFYETSAPRLEYLRGWFLHGYPHPIRYRGAQIIHMTARLNERAKAKG